MSGRFSKAEIDRLGDRIRASERLSKEDLRMLQVWRAQRAPDLDFVSDALIELGFEPTPRLKTHNTLVEKLVRQPELRLSRVQDVAGCRIVIEGGRPSQDEAVQRVLERFPESRVVDRRERPSYGYRAVHVVAEIGRWPVEIQVRTDLQHAWAELFEKFADIFGRHLRYGGAPDIDWSGSPWSPGRLLVPVLRREVVAVAGALQGLGDRIDAVERGGASGAEVEGIRHALLFQHEVAMRILARLGKGHQ